MLRNHAKVVNFAEPAARGCVIKPYVRDKNTKTESPCVIRPASHITPQLGFSRSDNCRQNCVMCWFSENGCATKVWYNELLFSGLQWRKKKSDIIFPTSYVVFSTSDIVFIISDMIFRMVCCRVLGGSHRLSDQYTPAMISAIPAAITNVTGSPSTTADTDAAMSGCRYR